MFQEDDVGGEDELKRSSSSMEGGALEEKKQASEERPEEFNVGSESPLNEDEENDLQSMDEGEKLPLTVGSAGKDKHGSMRLSTQQARSIEYFMLFNSL
jgi:hypothetical protein